MKACNSFSFLCEWYVLSVMSSQTKCYIITIDRCINVVSVFTGESGPENIMYFRAIKPLAKSLAVKLDWILNLLEWSFALKLYGYFIWLLIKYSLISVPKVYITYIKFDLKDRGGCQRRRNMPSGNLKVPYVSSDQWFVPRLKLLPSSLLQADMMCVILNLNHPLLISRWDNIFVQSLTPAKTMFQGQVKTETGQTWVSVNSKSKIVSG